MKINRRSLRRRDHSRKAVRSSKRRILAGSIALLAAVFMPAPDANALTYYWNAASGTWQTTGNWTQLSDGTPDGNLNVPGAGDAVVFNSSLFNGPETIGLTLATAAAGMTFQNTGTTTIQNDIAGTQTLAIGTGGITINSLAGAVTIGNATNIVNVTLAGTQTWNNAGTLTLLNGLSMGANPLIISGAGITNLNGVISGSVATGTTALTINTGHTVNLGGTANTFTGNINVDGGTLSASMVSATATSALGGQIGTTYRTLNLLNGGAFNSLVTWNNNIPSATSVGIIFNIGAGGGTLNVANGTTLTVDDGTINVTNTTATAQQLQGSGPLTKSGTGTLVLRQQFNFGGTIDITAGTLQMSGVGGGLGANTAGTTIRSGAALNLGGFVVTDTDTLTIHGTGLAGSPAGVITNNTATASGYNGPIVLGSHSTIGAAAAGSITLIGGVTGNFDLTINNLGTGGTAFSTVAVNNAGTITNSGPGAGTTTIGLLGGAVTAINQTGTSPLTLTPAYPTAQLGSTITNSGAGLYTLTGGVAAAVTDVIFKANAGGGITAGAIATTGTLTNNGTGTGTTSITGVIGANVTNVLQDSTTSALTLGNVTNLYTGTTTVNQGTLNVAGINALTATSSAIILGSATTSGTLNYTGATGTLAGTHVITVSAGGGEIDSTTGTLTIATPPSLNGPLTIGGANGVTFNTAAVVPITGTASTPLIKNGAGTFTLTTSGTSTLAISGAVPITINQGTFQQTTANTAGTANTLGTGTITFNPTTTNTPTLGISLTSITNTYSNPITVNAPPTGAGTAVISVSAGATFSGPIVLGAGAGAGTATLRLTNLNGSLFTVTVTGGITGTGNLALNGTGANAPITISGTNPVAITGSISNIGTNAATTSVATISAPITTTNVSSISQAGASPFTISSSLALTSTLNSFTSTGAGLWTLSGGFTGSQPLTLNANSTGGITSSGAIASTIGNVTLNANSTGAITLSTAAVNNTGTITNSGTGLGITTISANIGSAVTNIVQNSATSQLVLSGTNTYTGTSNATAGILNFSTTLAIPDYATSPATAFGTFASPRMTASSGGTLAFPFGAATNAITNADVTNFVNGTYNIFAAGSFLGIDTTNASPSPANLTAVVSDPAAGSLGLTKLGTNALTVNAANTYTGATAIVNGTLNVASLNSVTSGAASSSLGAPTTAANGTISLGLGTTTGVLSYTGTGETTDRVLNFAGTTGGGGLDQSGTGLLKFTSNTILAAGAKTLTLSGSTVGSGEISGNLIGSVAGGTTPLTITKTGTGTWTLSGTGNTSQNIIISGGTLDLGPNGITLGNVGSSTIQTTGGTSGNTAFIKGTINFTGVGTSANGADVGATVAGFTLDLTNAVLTGGTANNIDFFSAGTTILGNANTFQGQPQINGTTLQLSSLGTTSGAAPSSLGQPSGTSATSSPNSTIIATSGVLRYVGAGETTDRVLDFRGTTTATTVDQSGTGLLKFSAATTATGAGIKTITLQGSTAGTGEFSGNIVNNSTTNTTAITKTGTGTWTLSGVNGTTGYTGATTVNGGNLILAAPGALANTAITINNGATLSPLATFAAGNTATAARGASLNLTAGGTLNMADGATGTFNLIQNTTFAGNAATFAGGTIKFDLGTTLGANDSIDVRLNNLTGTGLATSSGSNQIVIFPTGASFTTGSYTLISAAGALNNSNFYLASPNLLLGGTLYNLTLGLSGTNEVLTVATGGPAVVPSTAYWAGTTNGSWSFGGAGTATNWVSAANGLLDTAELPGSLSNVFFTANTVGAGGLSTTLDGSRTINSLTFTGTGTANTAGSTIAAGSGGALTINAAALTGNAAGNGINVLAGSGANTISADVILGGSQTWTNNSTSALTVSGVVSESAAGTGLTKAGTGTLVLSNSNTYTGATTINGGVLSVGVLDIGGNASGIGQSSAAAGNLVFSGNGTLQYSGPTKVTDRAFTLNAGVTGTIDVTNYTTNLTLVGATGTATTGVLTKAGPGTLTLIGANTNTGNTNVNGGTLVFSGGVTLASARLLIGFGGNSGAVIQNAGTTMNIVPGSGSDFLSLGGGGGYGYYRNNGGTLTSGQIAMGGNSAGANTTGVFEQNGGSTTMGTAAGFVLTGWVGSNANGILNIFGGTFTNGSTANNTLMGFVANQNNFGMFNVLGATSVFDTTANGGQTTRIVDLAQNAGNFAGILNLNGGGTLKAVAVRATNTGTPTYFGIDGGILKASTAGNTTFISNLTNTTIYSGGATIDSNGVAITVPQPLLAPTGSGLASIPVTSGGAGYIGAPAVRVTGGGGTGASAIAIVDLDTASATYGQITGFTITSAGSGYTSAPTITLIGGGATTAATPGIATTAVNVTTGGLTKTNTGTLTLSGLNTFGGGVDIKGGVLSTTLLANGGVASGIGQSSNAASNVLLNSIVPTTLIASGGGILGYSGTVAGTTDRNFTLNNVSGGFDASGTVLGTFTLAATNVLNVASGLGAATLTLQGTGTGATGAGSIGTLLADGTATTVGLAKFGTGTWIIANDANSYTGSTVISGGILSVGKLDNGGSNSSIGASTNAASNLVLQGGTLQYTGPGAAPDRNFTFGNATTAAGGGIDSAGTGPLVISGTMTPVNTAAGTQTLTLTANTASGANLFNSNITNSSATALTAVTKAGPGAWTLAGTNTYFGNTTVGGGTLNITGSLLGNGTTTTGSTLAVANAAGNTAVVNVGGNISTYFAYTGANTPTSVSVYNQTGGTVNTTSSQTNNTTNFVAGNGGYGYFNINGGTFTNGAGRFTLTSSSTTTNGGTVGVVYVGNGGTLTSNADFFMVAYNGANDLGSLTIGPNGTLNHNGGAQPLGVFWTSPNNVGVINVAGGTLNVNSTTALKGIVFGGNNATGTNETGFLNLAGGTLSTGSPIGLFPVGAGSMAYINAAGGTIKTAAAVTALIPASIPTITVNSTIFGPVTNNSNVSADHTAFNTQIGTTQNFAGGLTFDTNNFNSSLTNVLNGASGAGVTQEDLTFSGGSGYVGAPMVQFSTAGVVAGGTPAAGYAVINSTGQVTGVVITSPGTYTAGTIPTITLSGGGGTGAGVVSGALNTANSNTGGLTKLSTGTLTLSGLNTFGGVVDIKGGVLATPLLANGGLASGIGQSSNAASNLLLDSSTATTLAASGGGILAYTGTVAGTTDRNFTLNNVSGGFDASGTVLGTFTLTSSNVLNVTGGLGAATLTLQGTGTGATGAGSIGTLLADGAGTTVGVSKFGAGTWNITNPANSYSGPTVISAGILSAAKLANGLSNSSIGASTNAASNLVLQGGTLQYTGTGDTTDRNFTFGNATTAAAGGIDSAGTGPLVMFGNMTGANAAAGTQTFTLTANAASGANSFNGSIVDSSATALTAVTKTGPGAWTLAGANTYFGNTTVANGTLNLASTGSLTGNGTTSAGSTLIVGNTAGTNAVMNINGGSISNYYTFQLGTNATAAGVINMTGGSFSDTTTSTSTTVNSVGQTGYGYLNVTGGTFAAKGRFATSNGAATTGVVYVGGTGTIDTSAGEWLLMAYAPSATAAGKSEITVAPGGKLLHAGASSNFGLNMDRSNGYAVLNVAGGLVTNSTKPITFGNGSGVGSGTTGILNVAAGTLTVGTGILVGNSGAGSTNNFANLNFAGGTIQANATFTGLFPATQSYMNYATTVFGPISNTGVPGAPPNFTGGITIDTQNFNVTNTTPILGATGNGVTQTNLTVNGGAGYVGAPFVQFSRPAAGGVPAAGYAVMNGDVVAGIVITSPGTYAADEVPTISLSGGGFSTAATVTSSPLTTVNDTTAGLTKQGTGTLTLSGISTYGGPTTISGGVLSVLSLSNGGVASTLGSSSNAASNLVLDGGRLGYAATTAVAGVTDRNFNITANGGGFDASGTVAGATLTINPSNALNFLSNTGTTVLTLSGSGLITTGFGTLNHLITDGPGTNVIALTKLGAGQWNISAIGSANSYTGATTLGGGILSVAKLANGGSVSSIGASSNDAANLVFQGGTLQYTGTGDSTDRNFTFGNATTAAGGGIDSAGTGPLTISGSMTAVNTAAGTQTLTLTANAASGANTISTNIADSSVTALTGLAKSGAGAWTVTGTNTFSGLTTINAGTLNYTGTGSGAAPITFTTGGNGVLNINTSGTVSAGAINWAGATAGVMNLNSGTLLANGNLTSASSTVNALSFNGGTLKTAAPITISGSLHINVQAGGGTIDTSGGSITSNSVISDTASPGALNIIGGNAVQSPVGANQTGPVNITGAGTTLRLAINGGISYPSLWTIGPGANLDLNDVGNFSFNGLAGSGTVLNTGATTVRTLTITGTGGTFSGSIQQPVPSATAATGVAINLTGGGTQIFNGVHTYGGPTTITNGTLALTGGSLGNTAISVASGATFAVRPGTGSLTAGSGVDAGLGASLDLGSGAIFSMVDGAIGTFNLLQESNFFGTPLSLNSSSLNLELSSVGADKIVVSGGSFGSSILGTNTINITTLGSSLTAATYPIISASGIFAGNTSFTFGNGLATDSVLVGTNTYPLTLTSVDGIQQITVGAALTAMTWTGQTNGNGAVNSVWSTAAGNKNFATNPTTAVDYANGVAATFQDLNVITGANVTNGIATIAAGGVTPSVVTVNNSAVNYTFQNASGTIGIAGATALIKTGSGTLTLLGANSFTGGTKINGGIVRVGVAEGATNGPLGDSTSGGLISFGGGTLQYSAANQYDYSARFAPTANNFISIDTNGQDVTFASPLTSSGGTLTKNGLGTLTLTTDPGYSTYTGVTVINGGTLKLNSSGFTLASGILAGTPSITVNSGGTLLLESTVSDLLGYTVGKEALIINSGGTVTNNGVGSRITLSNVLTMTGGTLSGTSLGDFNSGAFSLNSAGVVATSDAAGAPALISANISTQNIPTFNVARGTNPTLLANNDPDLVISGPITPYAATPTFGITKTGTGILTLSGLNTYAGNTTILGGTVNANSTQALGNNTAALILGDTTGNAATLNVNESNSIIGLTVNTSSPTNFNTINVATGKTLTVAGNVIIGPTAPPVTQTSKLTIGGGGSLAVSASGGTFQVGGSTTATTGAAGDASILDLTGLATATIDLGLTGTVRVNNPQGGNTSGVMATLLLPTPVTGVTPTTPVTTITANLFNVGDAGSNGAGAGQVNSVTLGTGLTTLNANTVNVATGGRDMGQITFASGNGTIVLRAADGTSRSAFNIGTGTATTGVSPGAGVTNNVDFSGHQADLLISSLTIGTQNRSAPYTNTFKFDTGTLDMTSLAAAARTTETAANGVGLARVTTVNITFGGGAVNIANGILQFGDLAGTYSTAGQSATENATLNISGGTVTIGNTSGTSITMARLSRGTSTQSTTVNASINLTGGTTTLTGNIVKGITTAPGAGAASNVATLTLDGAAAILDMSGMSIGGANTIVFNAQQGTLKNLGELNAGGALTKTTTGTLVLDGTLNAYSGGTVVSAGTLQLGSDNVIPDGLGKGNVSVTGILDLNGKSDTINGLTGAGLVDNAMAALSTSILTVGGNDASSNFSGVIQNSGTLATVGLTKTGSGTVTLSGAAPNTYKGLTKVSGGTLAISGSISGTTSVQVDTGGILLLNTSAAALAPAGNNIVNSAATFVGNGGTLALDNSQSSRTNTFASLALNASSTIDFGAGDTDTFLFTSLDAATKAALQLGTTINLTINGWSGTIYTGGEVADHGPASQDRLLFTNDPGFGNNTLIPGINFSGFGAGAIQVNFNGQFEIVPVPEPSSMALLGAAGLLGLGAYRDRGRARKVA